MAEPAEIEAGGGGTSKKGTVWFLPPALSFLQSKSTESKLLLMFDFFSAALSQDLERDVSRLPSWPDVCVPRFP